MKTYKNPLLHTSQFTMCGNCFRCDTYKGCSFGCKYCFANNRGGDFDFDFQVANIDVVEKWFQQAILEGDTSNIKKEMLNKYVPLHLGGMADPFQEAEWKFGATYKMLLLSKKYNYPVNISTKTAHLPDKYWEVLDPSIHTFSISIMGYNDDYIKTWESNTPSAKQRIEFVKLLKSKGFWVSIRIQPIIDIEECIELIRHSEKYVDYYTVEHLKLPLDNAMQFKALCLKLGKPFRLVAKGREYEFDSELKMNNIDRIKSCTNVKIGCGDNDLHILSDSLNCCGIDTMPKAFQNWLKYNTMYIKMTGDRSGWYPKNNCNQCFNSTCIKPGFTTMKHYVDHAYVKQYGTDNQMSLF